MVISVKQYAQSLHELLAEKNRDEIRLLIGHFADMLEENNDLAKTSAIIAEFTALWNRKNGIVEAEVASANKLDKETLKNLSALITEETEASEVVLSEKIEKNLLGGAILKYENQIMDMSLRTGLKSLRRAMEK